MRRALSTLLIFLPLLNSKANGQVPADPSLLKIIALQQAEISALKNMVPSGAILYFDLDKCPNGWEPLEAAKGRYLVGTTVGGTLGAQVGVALGNGENRKVGKHSHGVNDPGHAHTFGPLMRDTMFADNPNPPRGSNAPVEMKFTTDTAKTDISIESAGSVEGTNAPYVQYLICRKK
jgi:hypothetical protein